MATPGISSTGELKITLQSGIILNADLWSPFEGSYINGQGNKLAICLHPWSWLGGRKEDPVLGCLIAPLLTSNYHVLLYNSRGVGGSSGWSSFTGYSEAEDLKAVAKCSMENIPDVRSLVVIGYSHGSLIASLLPVFPSVKTSHILISYPLGTRSWLTLFKSSSYNAALKELIKQDNSNVLIVYGDQDEFTSLSKYEAWCSELGGGNVEIREIHNASHFWRGKSAVELIAVIEEWMNRSNI